VMVLRNRRSDGGPFYGCSRYPACSGTHGAHADGTPLGVPGDAATKRARREAHAAFDRLWHGGPFTRRRAYAWLAQVMGITSKQAHIGRFTRLQCREVVRCVRELLGDPGVTQRPLVPIAPDDVASQVGRCVHVATDRSAEFVYQLVRVEDGTAFLRTPKTRRRREVPVGLLCYTRKREPAPAEVSADV
jgi:hypothetical protein